MKQAIYTVANNDFFEGIYTLVYSFYKHNPSFKGDFIISYSKSISPLSKKNRDIIKKTFSKKNIVFKKINEEPYLDIKNKANNPYTSKKIPGLLKLDLFKETTYDKILYMDTDILLLKNILHLFEEKANLVAFRDIYSSKNLLKYSKKQTVLIKDEQKLIPPYKIHYITVKNWLIEKSLYSPNTFFLVNIPINIIDKFITQPFNPIKIDYYFNSGFFIVDKTYLDGTYFDKLKNINLRQKFWFHVDQDVLNIGLLTKNTRVTYLEPKYNGIKVKYDNKSFVKFLEEKPYFIHYVGKKPWQKKLKLPITNPLYAFYKKIFYQEKKLSKIESVWKTYNKEAHDD